MGIPFRRPTKNHRIHAIFLMGRHIAVEIIHKVLPLHALIAPVTDLSREELNDSRKWGYREEGANPRIVYFCLRRHRVSDV
jgi:hypothetical protein